MSDKAVLKYKGTELPFNTMEYSTSSDVDYVLELDQDVHNQLFGELGYKVTEPLTIVFDEKSYDAICTEITSACSGCIYLHIKLVSQGSTRLPRSAKKVDLKNLKNKVDPINPDHYKGNTDPINPDHYKGKVECIEALEAILGRNGVEDYCNGCAIKYLWRWRKKNGLEDLQKAQWYINRLIAYVQKDYEGLKNDLSSMLENNEPAPKD